MLYSRSKQSRKLMKINMPSDPLSCLGSVVLVAAIKTPTKQLASHQPSLSVGGNRPALLSLYLCVGQTLSPCTTFSVLIPSKLVIRDDSYRQLL